MKLGNGKANRQKKAILVLGAVLAAVLGMTTVSAALQTSVPAPASPKAREFAKTTVRWVLVSIPDRKLALFANGKVVRIYRIAVGKTSTPSPVGEFKIVNRVSNPTYYHKGQVIAAGKGNPVGTRWMGLSAKGYGIHAPTSRIRSAKRHRRDAFAWASRISRNSSPSSTWATRSRFARNATSISRQSLEMGLELELKLEPGPKARRSRRLRPDRVPAADSRRGISCRDEACLVPGG